MDIESETADECSNISENLDSDYAITQTDEFEQEEHKPTFDTMGKVQAAIDSWKSEINVISKNLSVIQAKKSKSRVDQWHRFHAKAKAERERHEQYADKFVNLVDSMQTKLGEVMDEVEENSTVSSVFEIFTSIVSIYALIILI